MNFIRIKKAEHLGEQDRKKKKKRDKQNIQYQDWSKSS
jgi:hypothetical protein